MLNNTCSASDDTESVCLNLPKLNEDKCAKVFHMNPKQKINFLTKTKEYTFKSEIKNETGDYPWISMLTGQ